MIPKEVKKEKIYSCEWQELFVQTYVAAVVTRIHYSC